MYPGPKNFVGEGGGGGVVETYHGNFYANNMISHTS